MTVKVLGPLDVGAKLLSPRERAILSVLVVRLGSAVQPSELADAYWGERVPSTWRQQVQTSIARIRTQLGHDAVITTGSTYLLGIDPDAIDAVRFERLVSSARQRALHGEADRAADLYARALALWRGRPYADLSSWDPAIVEALRLTEIRTSAEEEWLDARLDAGEHRAIIADAERLVREDPLREDRWAILALANYRAGRQAEALATVRAARGRLLNELGIDVGPRLSDLETAILRQDPDIAPLDVKWDAASECPYPGLAPYDREDAELFFGREADVDVLTERTRPGSVLTIAGPSGSGKSSVLLAGVVPRLASTGNEVAVIRPAAGGTTALRSAIERGARVVAIDQAEELMQASTSQAAEFCEVAAGFLASGGAVILTIRSDFLDRATELPSVGAAIGRGVYVLAPLSPQALRVAIEEPARHARLRLEPGLVEIVIRDSSDRTTTLPHVSHALRETWIRREGATLTVTGYEAAGGIAGAIAQTAETVFRSLDAASQELCRSLLLRLVERGADGASLRRRVTAAPLLEDPARRDLIETLVAARLVTADGDAIVIAHEAIATAWPRLDGWLEEDAEGARLMGSLTTAAETWDADGRTLDGLLRGARFHATAEWVRRVDPDLTALERALLAASDDHDQDEVRELAARAARDKRNNRRLRWALSGAGVLLVLAILGGGLAAVRGGEAEAAAENARAEALVATSLALLDNDREAAALLAAEAYRRWPDDPRVRSALWGVTTSTGGLVDMHRDESVVQPWMAMIPDTGMALRAWAPEDDLTETIVDVVDIASGEIVDSFDIDVPESVPFAAPVVEVSPDGRMAAISRSVYPDPSNTDECCWNHISLIDLEGGTPLPGPGTLHAPLAEHMTWDAAGSTLYLAQMVTADVIAVDTTTGEFRASSAAAFTDQPLTKDERHFAGPALIDDNLIAVGASDRVLLYDRATLALVRTIQLDRDVASEAIIADGHGGIVTTGWDGTARLDLATEDILWRRFLDQTRNCVSLHLATDTSFACGSYGGLALVNLATGETTGDYVDVQFGYKPQFDTVDDESLLIFPVQPSVWMRWRIDGGGGGADVVAKGRELAERPASGEPLVVTQPKGGGPMQLWDLARDVPVGDESARIIALGSGVAARFAEYEPVPRTEPQGRRLGEPRIESISTGQEIPLQIPGLPRRFNVVPGAGDGVAFAWWRSGVVAFDPSSGQPLGPIMTVPGARFDEFLSASETPNRALAVITWSDYNETHTETAVFDIATGALQARGLFDLHLSRVLDAEHLVGIEEYVRRYDIRTLEPVSALAKSVAGGALSSLSSDGRTLLSVGFNNSLTLYDMTADIVLAGPIDSAVDATRLPGGYLTADGETLLEALPDGIRVWDLRPAQQASTACALAGRELSDVEWSTYFPGEEQVATCAALAG